MTAGAATAPQMALRRHRSGRTVVWCSCRARLGEWSPLELDAILGAWRDHVREAHGGA